MTAAIDIGSNSIRLATSDGVRRSEITKLADGIEKTGLLSPVGFERTVEVLKDFAAISSGCDKVYTFATEAVRRAQNGKKFCAEVKRVTGLDVAVLSPETEAEMALFGATKPTCPVTVCDLGGGSLEMISSNDGVTPDYVKSLPLGVVVLKNMFECGDTASSYRKAIDRAPALVKDYEIIDRPVVFIGGSATTIAAGLQNLSVYDGAAVDGYKITMSALDGFMPVLSSPRLSVMRPVCAKRADTVMYGAIIIQALLNRLGQTEFYVSDHGNLDAAINGFFDRK